MYVKQNWVNAPSETTPLSATRLNHLETQFDEAKLYTDSQVSATNQPRLAKIKHVEAGSYNYEVMRISGGFGAINKVQPAGVNSSGEIPVGSLLTPKAIAAAKGVSAVVNCDAYGGTTTIRSVGLHILNGVAYQNFGVQATSAQGSDREALLLMRDGSLQKASITDGLTAQQYVDQGAYASFGYGPILVENGVAREWWTMTEFSGFVSSLSARTILGQASNGDYILITVEGASGVYGITGQTLTTVALAEGCQIAINLDGGGSTQAMWMGDVIHPSSDPTAQRPTMTYIAVQASPTNVYDTGDIPQTVAAGIGAASAEAPALSLRQRGNQVSIQFAATGTFPIDSWVQVSQVPFPARYTAVTASYMRGVVYGTSGLAMGISYGSASGLISARTRTGPAGSNLEGVMTYPAKGS